MTQKRRSPHEGGNGHRLAGLVQGHHTEVRALATDLSSDLASLADQHHRMPRHEVSWRLWALYDCARTLQRDFRPEVRP
jgi:hypothetical protein